MAFRRYRNGPLAISPTPGRSRNIYHPNFYRDDQLYAYSLGRRRTVRHDYEAPQQQHLSSLCDKTIDNHGDLGWSLEYATAYCYKHLNGNRPGIVDAIDRAREADLDRGAPFMLFDHLDRALFIGKLRGMVYLRWKTQASSAPGTTSAPGVMASRVCIELNSTPFEDEDGDIEDLLDALIHQMIHAYFLVCCGAQQKGGKQDGRLLDALHFGVVLSTIRDITRKCRDGILDVIFYAACRQVGIGQPSPNPYFAYGYGTSSSQRGRDYIAIDPRGSTIGPPPADGQSHCMHDNRKFTRAMVRNWQVEEYSRCIDLEMDAKGDLIHDLGAEGKLVPTDRLKGPPSATYVELIWDDKRIMVPKDKILKFSSLKRPLHKDGKRELRLPECTFSTLKCIYDFILLGSYYKDPAERLVETTTTSAAGPPILVGLTSNVPDSLPSTNGIITHIKVFKVGESLKFEELQWYALQRLYDVPSTSDDPIAALRELYNEGEKYQPIHAELHKWARKFLARTEDFKRPPYSPWDYGQRSIYRGISNYEKIVSWLPERFQELYNRNMALKDNCKLVVAELAMSGHMPSEHLLSVLPGLPAAVPFAPYERLLAPRPRNSWDSTDDINRRLTSSATSASSSSAALDLAYPPTLPAFRSLRVADTISSPLGLPAFDATHKHYSRVNGRLKRWNALTGETWEKANSPLWSGGSLASVWPG